MNRALRQWFLGTVVLACIVAPGAAMGKPRVSDKTQPAAKTAAASKPLLEIEKKTLTSRKGTALQAEAGRLMVPENRLVRGSRMIPIRFLRLKSTAASPKAPLFFLQGGPGAPAVDEHPDLLEFWVPFLAVSDVVLINQRGVTDSLLRWQWDGPPPMSYFVSADSALKHEAEMTRRAAAAFRARGVDLAGYTTVESAADLDALRAALGVERVSLLAFSYGTHLACAYLRAYGPHVDNAVLLGLEGPDQTNKLPWAMDTQFRKLALLTAADPKIGGKVPDLLALYDRVIAKLERQPMVVTIPMGPDTLRVPIGAFGLRYMMRFDMGDATDLVVFPRLLWSIDHGDPSVLAWFVRKRARGALGINGMSSVMDAASGTTPGRQALIAFEAKTSRFADVVNFPYPAVDQALNAPDLGDEFRSPLVSGARTLLLSGDLDFNTPPYQAEELRWGMTNTTHLIVEHAGHEQTFWQNDTAAPVVIDFLAGKDVRDRKITYPPLRFVPLEGLDPEVTHPSVK